MKTSYSSFYTVIATLLASFVLISGASAEGDSSNAERFDQACSSDIEKYCSQVLPGDGRISACLYAHTDLITEECYATTENITVILEGVFDGIETFYAACMGDLQKYCADKKPGAGEQLACLKEKEAAISAGCNAAMPTLGKR